MHEANCRQQVEYSALAVGIHNWFATTLVVETILLSRKHAPGSTDEYCGSNNAGLRLRPSARVHLF